MKNYMKPQLFLLLSILFLLAIILGCGDKEIPIQTKTRFLMDTICTIQVPGDLSVLEYIDSAFDRMEEVDAKFNALNNESPIYAFNENDVPIVDEEIVGLIKTALQVSRESNGCFDITVYPMIDLWGFFTENPAVPDSETVQSLLSKVGYEGIAVENNTIIKSRKDVKIDLGSIAKGYAIGEAGKTLKNLGISSALIDGGGDVYALGMNGDKPWKIGIRNPRGEDMIGVLELVDMAVVTSGDYERYFEKDGVRYHHILDPRTGYPTKGTASVTVISPDPSLADAWSTALFVLGPKSGLASINGRDDLSALIVDSSGKHHVTPETNVEKKTIVK